ncbi:MarR family winged helix-turn-helix transcriptional regulator [Amycolatopsis solani]|uniref:MarR family winged helix-turn-helix transcriptional regulator n=1 Tax=Amycolatopsis solani TaxID=3028615 RepID=UPI0025B1D8BE|nr:MarR family transcriptional regulator [Amycolatopsis sp. MEP2-6]
MTVDEQSWGRMLVLHARIEQDLAKALQRRHGLGLSEYRALGKLVAGPRGGLRMQELADAIGLNQSSVSRMCARLEDAGLTIRDLCEDDRRGVYSVITDAGRKRYAETEPTYCAVLRTALDQAASDPELAGAVAAVRGA